MKFEFHNRQFVVLALAIGGLIGFGKDLVAGVVWLHRFALTPSGLAILVVTTTLLSAASLAVALIRR